MAWAQAIAAGLPVVGALVGELLAAGDEAGAEELRRQAMQEYNIELPPVREIASQAVSSRAANARGNAEAKGLRMQALRDLQSRASEGYNAEDRAAINDTLADVQTAERGSREAIMRQMDPNSGAAIQAQLANNQNAAQMANRRGLNIAAGSRRQALEALRGVGSLAGDIDESEFGQAYKTGAAADALSQFNEANRMRAAEGNRAAEMDRTQQQMALADRRYGAKTDAADARRREADRKRKMLGGMGMAGQQGVYGYTQYKG